MNVVIHIAPPLRVAFEGRERLELGVPEGAHVGDVFQSVIALYPRLLEFWPRDSSVPSHYFSAFWSEHRQLYLFALSGGHLKPFMPS